MSRIVTLLTVCGFLSLLAGSGQTSTTESMAVPSLLVSNAGESVVVSGLPTVAPAKALTVSNLVMPCLASSDVGKAMFEPPVVKSLIFSCLSDAAVTKFVTWPGLIVTALAKFLAVPAAVESVTFPDLDTTGKLVARSILASRIGCSALLTSLDGFSVGILIATSGLWITTVLVCLALSSFVLTTDKFAAEVALWRYARDLGIPLGLHLPLPGEVLGGACPMGPGPGRLDEL